MARPASKNAGSIKPCSSALSSASRCRKTGTAPRSGVRPGVPCIPFPPLHGPVGYEPVAEGPGGGPPPPLELPYRLDDLLVEARQPPRQRAGDAVRELESRRAALGDHAPECLAWDLDSPDIAGRPHRRRGPTLPEEPPLPHHRRLARGLYLCEQTVPAAGEPLPYLDLPGRENVQAPRLRTLLDDGLAHPETDGLGDRRELLPLLFGHELEEPDPLQSFFQPSLTPSAQQPLTANYMPRPLPAKRPHLPHTHGQITSRRGCLSARRTATMSHL